MNGVQLALSWREHVGKWPLLEPDAVHLWSVELDSAPADGASLAAEEATRARRFHRERDRARFIAGRAALREILARYLGAEPAALRLVYGHQGKPSLPAHPELHFNLSHAGGLALIAVTGAAPVGVDVEEIRAMADASDIATGYFAPGEIRELASYATDDRAEAFLRGWTRKEAFIKAIGDGLAFPLDSFEVSLARAPARLRSIAGSPGEEAAWTLRELHPADGFVAALAVARAAVTIRESHLTARSLEG